MTFGEWVAARRQEIGWKQKDLAEQVGLSPQYVSDIEHDRRVPPAATVERMADALAVPRSVALFRCGLVWPDLLALDRPDEAVATSLVRAREILELRYVWPVGEKSYGR